jgi:phage head maturation protease
MARQPHHKDSKMNQLKAISQTDTELRVGNYMVLFGGRDLTGEFFTPTTDFRSAYTDIGMLYVDFEHGRDPEKMGNSAANVLGVVDWKSAKVDDKGIFVERVLNRRASYIKYLAELIDAGMVGTSSEAVSGKTAKKSTGEIVEWPLMRDSLTVTPMEPRMIAENALTAAKALCEIFPNSKSLALLTGATIVDDPAKAESIEVIPDLKSAEQYLRDAGLSRTEAKAFIAKVKSLGRSDSDGGEMQQIVNALKCRDAVFAA